MISVLKWLPFIYCKQSLLLKFTKRFDRGISQGKNDVSVHFYRRKLKPQWTVCTPTEIMHFEVFFIRKGLRVYSRIHWNVLKIIANLRIASFSVSYQLYRDQKLLLRNSYNNRCACFWGRIYKRPHLIWVPICREKFSRSQVGPSFLSTSIPRSPQKLQWPPIFRCFTVKRILDVS